MKIRKANQHDILQLVKLFDDYRVFYGQTSDTKQALAFLTDRFHHNDSVILVAESDSPSLAGFVQLYPLFSSVRMKKLWLLNDLYVEPDFRGMGISVQLIDEAKNICRESGACGIFLETQKTNTAANSLYIKTGFDLIDHNFYEWSV